MESPDALIEAAVARYVREMGRYEEAARLVERRLRAALRDRRVSALVSSRAKHPDDLREKLRRKGAAAEDLTRDVGDVVNDLAGCRVLAYRPSDVERLEAIVREVLTLADLPMGIERHAKPSGYRATHVLVVIADDERLWMRGAVCEVQIVSIASHVFNEIEHDLVYKRAAPGPGRDARLDEILRLCRALDDATERVEPT